jgi:hypothetical protein
LLRGMRDAEPVGDARAVELRRNAASARRGDDRDDDDEEDEDVGDPIELPCCRMARAELECEPVCGIELALARRGWAMLIWCIQQESWMKILLKKKLIGMKESGDKEGDHSSM